MKRLLSLLMRKYAKQLESVLTALVEKNTDMIIRQEQQTVAYVNQETATLLGYDEPAALLNQAFAKVAYLEDLPPALTAARSNKTNVFFEKRPQVSLIKRSGEILRVSVQALMLPIEADERIILEIRSEQNHWEKLEAARSKEAALLVKHADQVPGVVYQFQLFTNGHVEFPFISDRILDISAVPVDQLRANGNVFFKYRHPDDLENFRVSGARSKKTLSNWSMDFRPKAKGEGYRWMYASSKPVRLSEDSVLWYGYMEDITEEEQVKADFRDSEEKGQTLFEDAPDALAILNQDASIVRWNPKAVDVFGWQAEEIMGQRLYEVLAPERNHAVYRESMARYHEGTGYTFINKSLELSALRKNGEEFSITISISSMRSKEELFFLCFMGDIAKRKQAQDKLQHSLKEKEVLLKEIHHRVKNNLQVITNLLSLQSSFINDLFKKSQYRINLMGRVHEMLYQSEDLSKINYKKYLERLTLSLKMAMLGSDQNIAVFIDMPGICLNIDRAIPLSLIVNKLLTNSFKYAFVDRTMGKVTLQVEALEAPNFVLQLQDDGLGYSMEPDRSKAPSLGLLLVRKLAIQLQGRLERLRITQGTAYRLFFQEITAT